MLGRPGAPYLDGFGLVAPTNFSFGGDSQSFVSNITWNSWGGDEATGTGTASYAFPGQAGYQSTPHPAAVIAFDLGDCGEQLMYQEVEWYFPEFGQSPSLARANNICSG